MLIEFSLSKINFCLIILAICPGDVALDVTGHIVYYSSIKSV